jgi:hypothetical protein
MWCSNESCHYGSEAMRGVPKCPQCGKTEFTAQRPFKSVKQANQDREKYFETHGKNEKIRKKNEKISIQEDTHAI